MVELNASKINLLYRRLPKRELFLSVAIFTAAIALCLVAFDSWRADRHESARAANLESTQYTNLNLAIAAKAVYASPELRLVKDLGINHSVTQRIIEFDVPRDGLSEFGLMTTPAGAVPKTGYPVIILCHGYTNPQNYSTTEAYLTDMEFYTRHGFAVIKPDFRGQGLSLASGSPDGAYYSMGYNTDVMSLIAAIKNTPYLDKQHINIWGHSMGAYVALRASVLSRDIKSVILLSGPVGTPADMFSDYDPISDEYNPTALSVRQDELTAHGTPLSNPSYWQKASPLSYLKYSRAYIQIHVGSADQIVPPIFSADLNRALDTLGKAHGYFVYRGAEHGLVNERSLIWQRSLQVLTR